VTSRVLLIGMMGSGKSTVGRVLGARLGWSYLDSDAEIVRSTGQTVPEIFAERGEAGFRAEEARVLAEATTSLGPAVIAVAGGAVLDPDNRRRIKAAGLVVWLRAEVAVLAERVGSGTGRPLLGHDPAAALARLYAERRDVYAALADLTVDVDGQRPGQVADQIVTSLYAHGITGSA
jgi:shikimate kinase